MSDAPPSAARNAGADDRSAREAGAEAADRQITDTLRAGGQSPYSPEARKKRMQARARMLLDRGYERVGPGTRFFRVVRRVVVGTYTDGFIHAGNLAYLALIALFPFFILMAAVLSLFGNTAGEESALGAVLATMPPTVADALAGPLRDVMHARSGIFLWLGAAVAVWTVGSLIETVRDILRRAYGTHFTRGFFHYRLLSSGIIFGAVVLMIASFSLQVVIGGAAQAIQQYLPPEYQAAGSLTLSRVVTGTGLYIAIFLLFITLTPSKYRGRRYPKWPGALFVTLWWTAVTLALPPLLAGMLSYDATYGSLAGVMVALFFFYLVGLGMVVGAELNAALVEVEEPGHDHIGRHHDVPAKEAQ